MRGSWRPVGHVAEYRCRSLLPIVPKGLGHFTVQGDIELYRSLDSEGQRRMSVEGELLARGSYEGSQPEEVDIPVTNAEGQ